MLNNHDASTTDSQTLDALNAAGVEIERHVGTFGWDQPARLFALVPTARLLETEPTLRGQLTETAPGALSSVEQDEFRSGTDLLTDLQQIAWPETVDGCALATERAFLTSEYESQIPEDPAEAADFVANHPSRQDLRIVALALRTGEVTCVARLRTQPDELLVGQNMVPALTEALLNTLR